MSDYQTAGYIAPADRIAELEKRLAEVTANYDEYVNDLRTVEEAEIATLTARLAEAAAALKPFAKVAADIDPRLEDYMAHHYDHLVGHYRAAAEAAKGGRDE